MLRKTEPIDKETFGSVALAARLVSMNEEEEIEGITFVGLCTDICVISNALLAKAYLPETPVYVDAACCAGVTPKSHETSLQAMRDVPDSYIRCEMTPISVGGEQQISISGGSQSPI